MNAHFCASYFLIVLLVFHGFLFLLSVSVAPFLFSSVLRSFTASHAAIFVGFHRFLCRGNDYLRCMSSDKSGKLKNIVIITD